MTKEVSTNKHTPRMATLMAILLNRLRCDHKFLELVLVI